MITLHAEFPDIADDLVAVADRDPALAEALDDYREACERSRDDQLTPAHRDDWCSTRNELAAEIRRLFFRHKQ